jgi:hypothetical protein
VSTSPKQQVTLIAFSTFLAAFSVGSIVNFTDPASSSWVTFGFFYASLFIFCLGLFTLVGLGLRQKLSPGHYVVNLGNSFRQGFFVGLLIVASFVLLSKHLLFWWVELTLILFLAAVEAFLNLKV